MTTVRQVLVVYYSRTGNTARVAQDLATRLDADTESIRDTQHGAGWLGYFQAALNAWRQRPAAIDSPQRNAGDYPITLVGTPVWSWQMTPAVRAYLQQARGKFHQVAFFITSGNTDIAKLAPSLEASANCKAVAVTGFNARELGNPVTYEKKLSAFIDAIKRVATSH